ncbi:hypothetical protein ABZ619_38790 [Streptomyces sp. NPDC007851]|uniref:hypothetical protein n=1 Tax=Streptomyces sp. NPDC007851 TaxID=3155008 RepID=UPI0033F953D8
MPTPKSPPARDPEPTPQPEEAAAPAEAPTVVVTKPVAEPAATEDASPAAAPPGVYEYTHISDCVYPHVPLTCRAATVTADATVFDWPDGPPADGRWAPTTKTPNQVADNAAPLVSEE